jgi:iron(III) transport system permease protein
LALGYALLLAGVMLSPLVLVVLDARSAGWSQIHAVVFRERSVLLLRHTLVLTGLVVACSSTLGVLTAWITERSALPFRRVWTVLLMLPLAMPDFVVGWTWHARWPRIDPLFGATLVMTLGTYPLIYLPVAAALRRCDPGLEDVAHSLGLGRVATFLRVSLPQLVGAVAGGAVLVALTVISEYGAFEVLRYPTFTTEVFLQFRFSPPAAGALSIPLVLLGLLVLSGEAAVTRRWSRGRGVVRSRRCTGPWWRALPPALLPLGLVGLGVVLPVGSLIGWIVQGRHSTLPATATLAQATATTVRYSAAAAVVCALAAIPVALLSLRTRTRPAAALERASFVTRAVPGVVVALSLIFFSIHWARGVYQTGSLLVLAYVIIHFPLALVCVRAAAERVPAALIDTGASLGRSAPAVFLRVTLPLIAPGLAAGLCLVFLTAATELTATLVLAPIGSETLATQFWAYQNEIAYGAAAPYALTIVALSVVPGTLLALWFDRESNRTARAAR